MKPQWEPSAAVWVSFAFVAMFWIGVLFAFRQNW